MPAHKETQFHIRDYIYLGLFGLICTTASLTQNLKSDGLNTWSFWCAWGIWGFEFCRLIYKHRSQFVQMIQSLGKNVFKSSGYFSLWISFLPAPLLNALDGQLTPMEGIWTFVLLSFSMQPLRYWFDLLKEDDDSGILRIIDAGHDYDRMAA